MPSSAQLPQEHRGVSCPAQLFGDWAARFHLNPCEPLIMTCDLLATSLGPKVPQPCANNVKVVVPF